MRPYCVLLAFSSGILHRLVTTTTKRLIEKTTNSRLFYNKNSSITLVIYESSSYDCIQLREQQMQEQHKYYLHHSIKNSEVQICNDQTICADTRPYTARSPKAKFFTNHPGLEVNWSNINQPICPQLFDKYWLESQHYLKYTDTYFVGNHSQHSLPFVLRTEKSWHQIFAIQLFFSLNNKKADWVVHCVPSYKASPAHPVLIATCLKSKRILISGTAYAGEIKKSLFSVMNYLLPQESILPMHCAAISCQEQTTLILGLSGTGKTSLSSSPSFELIGDDEHAWCDEGIFNIEAGCYAKCADLSLEREPDIYQAVQNQGVLENVFLKPNGQPDFNNTSLTQNSRGAFSLKKHARFRTTESTAKHPKNIVFLCCDLYGVVPMLSRLTHAQARKYFLLGYTAKVGSTEVGAPPIQPTSSPCFGAPFFPRSYHTYADLFSKKITAHNSNIWLVNTGWANGDVHSTPRIQLSTSKAIISAIAHNQVDISSEFEYEPLETVSYQKISNAPMLDLRPSKTWVQSNEFKTNQALLSQFLNTRITHD
ncbi:phosphoenolpyruvate carboxykinase (ATP) [Candidatus Comchoanobacter bicostacola]|uniref:Phosphoenolpyruvate carboxykinase (ATP) n=1 Tax=Candidatus Comchoanobacter bicostacola TaxID=2919598 RepID=A0ABY5DIV6_9GAMM|nr:phosphoenolpyruvate carboxykinase (ATP) [Candidatus Comchoanobacter bicostacola]UTC24526.1 phosphoenolpyruvate carboxykinase (ATP) [Candidatus Comchoanobacter bicostacola]